jgi:hypothetical protein
MKTKIYKAFSSIEILLAICIFAIMTIGVFYLSMDVVQNDAKVSLDSQALFYAQEGVEAVISIRDRNFLNVVNGTHGLVKTGGQWMLGPPPEVIDSTYQRKIIISDVYRNDQGNIDPEGDVLDISTKKVTSQVFWYDRGTEPRTTEITSYIADWRGDKWVTTTCDDFLGGTMSATESQQSAAPPANNCKVQLTQQEVESELVGSLSIGGNVHSNDVEVDGNYAYLMKRKSPELAVVNVANRQAPSIVTSLAVGGNNSNETFVTKYGNYLYLGVSSTTGGLVIVNVSNPASPVKSKTVNIGGQGYKPAVSGDYLFMPVAGKGTSSLKIYNIADRINPVYVTTIPTANQVRTVEISGNYAFVGLNNSSGWGTPVNSFAIYDIANLDSYYQQKISEGGSGCITVVTGNLNYYIPLKQSTSGLYPTYGHSSDSVTLTKTSRSSNGYVIVPFTFNNMPLDLHNASLKMNFVDLDLHGDFSSTLLLTEAFTLMDVNNNNLITLTGTYPEDDNFSWEYPIPSGLLGQTSLTFKARLTGLVDLQGNNTITVTNSSEQINNISVCGISITFPFVQDDGITNPANIVKVSDLNVGDWINTIKVSGPMAYLGMTRHHNNPTFVAVNINNVTAPAVAAALNVNNTIADLAISDTHAYCAVDSNPNSGFLTISISNPFVPVLTSIQDAGGKSTGIAADDDYVYVSVDTSNKGMSIFGKGDPVIASSGSYISPAYDTGSADTLYNYIEWDTSVTQGGTVKFQVRTADTSDHLSSAIWAGPTGTNATYYESSRTAIFLSPSRSGNRYYQYMAYFTSNAVTTPILESVNLDYIP